MRFLTCVARVTCLVHVICVICFDMLMMFDCQSGCSLTVRPEKLNYNLLSSFACDSFLEFVLGRIEVCFACDDNSFNYGTRDRVGKPMLWIKIH